jgi:hypothetical protein
MNSLYAGHTCTSVCLRHQVALEEDKDFFFDFIREAVTKFGILVQRENIEALERVHAMSSFMWFGNLVFIFDIYKPEDSNTQKS